MSEQNFNPAEPQLISPTDAFRIDPTQVNRPWLNEQGIIERAPNKKEALEWAEKMITTGSGVIGASKLIEVPKDIASEEISLLGKNENTENFISQSEKNIFGYGNEQIRLKELKKMTFDKFKNSLLKLNTAVRRKGQDDSPEHSGFTTDGRFANLRGRIPHIYPDSEDTMDVLEYAFEKSKGAKDIQDSALILSGGFVASHPFNDGNGRVSRQIYAELSAGISPEDEVFDLITASTSMSKSEKGGSGIINIGSFANQEPQLNKVINENIYEKSDVTRYNARITGLNYTQNDSGQYLGPPAKALEGLSNKQSLWLDDVYANVRDITLDRTEVASVRGEDESFRFALSYAVEKNPGYIVNFEKHTERGQARELDVDKLFNSSNKEFMTAMADGAREYYKQYAKTVIDMLGDSDLAQKQIEHPGGGKITVRDRIIEVSKNFLADSFVPNQNEENAKNSLNSRIYKESSIKKGKPDKGSRKNPIVVNNVGFRGDPRRVIGHPSNEFSNISSAYIDQLNKASS